MQPSWTDERASATVPLVGGSGVRVIRPGSEIVAEGHVHHVHLVGGCAVHGCEDHLGVGRTLAAEHPVGAEGDMGGHAPDVSGGWVAARADDACHVGAVAVAGVVGEGVRLQGGTCVSVVVVTDEVVAVLHPRGAWSEVGVVAGSAGAAEVGMVVVDAAVDHADRDAVALVPLDLGDIGSDHRQRVGEIRLDLPVRKGDGVDGVDRGHAAHRPQPGDLSLAGLHGEAVPHPRVAVQHRELHAVVAGRALDAGLPRLRGRPAAAPQGRSSGDLDEPLVGECLPLQLVRDGTCREVLAGAVERISVGRHCEGCTDECCDRNTRAEAGQRPG